MARQGSFLSGPTGVHNTQKIRKHVLKRGVTRDMNSAAWDQDSVKQPTQDDQVLGAVGLQLEES